MACQEEASVVMCILGRPLIVVSLELAPSRIRWRGFLHLGVPQLAGGSPELGLNCTKYSTNY